METKLSLRPNQTITSQQPECKDDPVDLVLVILIGNYSFSSFSYTGWTNSLRKNGKLRRLFQTLEPGVLQDSTTLHVVSVTCDQCNVIYVEGSLANWFHSTPKVNNASLLKRVVFTEKLHYLQFVRCYSCFVHKIMTVLTWQSWASIHTDRNSTFSL